MNKWSDNLNPSSGWGSQEDVVVKRGEEMTSWKAFFWEFARGSKSSEKDWGSERIRMCCDMNVKVRWKFKDWMIARLKRMKNE